MSDDDLTITVQKTGFSIPVSCCTLARNGGPQCDHPAAPPLPWRRRVRYRLASWWYDNRPHVHRGPCPVEEDW